MSEIEVRPLRHRLRAGPPPAPAHCQPSAAAQRERARSAESLSCLSQPVREPDRVCSLAVAARNPQEYLKKNNIKNAVEKVVNAAVKQKALEPYSVMVRSA